MIEPTRICCSMISAPTSPIATSPAARFPACGARRRSGESTLLLLLAGVYDFFMMGVRVPLKKRLPGTVAALRMREVALNRLSAAQRAALVRWVSSL